MARPVTTPGSAGGAGAAFVIPGIAAFLFLASCSLWVAGPAASALSGHGWHAVPFDWLLALKAALGGTEAFWPGVDRSLVWSLTAAPVLIVAGTAAVVGFRILAHAPRTDDPLRSLARLPDVRHLTARRAAEAARRLRPSLKNTPVKDVPPGEAGVMLGDLEQPGSGKGPCLFTTWEDVVTAFMAPRSGKTTGLVIPQTLDAPGAVVVTSNKGDAHAATAALRAQYTGERVWTFDPQRIAGERQTWWWDPLRGLDTVEEAERLAGHFVLTVDDPHNKDIWGPAAQELLAALLLAAKVSGGTMMDVYKWLNDESTPTPAKSLENAGLTGLAASLRASQFSPPETRGSVYFTARVAARCLRNDRITEWVTPPAAGKRLEEFNAAAFPISHQTLYLLSKDGGGSAAPLVAALTDRVMRAGVTAAESMGGRLDAPMLVLLDEAANICRIADLPQLYSHLGSRGIIPVTILQSYAQGVGVWGDTGMKALWSASTVKVVGAGIDDATFAEDLSRLIGDHDVVVESTSSSQGRSTRSKSLRQQRILPPSAIRALPKGRALVWLTGAKVAMVRTRPWYTSLQAEAIKAAIRVAEQSQRAHLAPADTPNSTTPAGKSAAGPSDADTATEPSRAQNTAPKTFKVSPTAWVETDDPTKRARR